MNAITEHARALFAGVISSDISYDGSRPAHIKRASGRGAKKPQWAGAVVAAVALVLMLALVGCGPSRPRTLAEAFSQEDLDEIAQDYASSIQQLSGIPTTSTVTIKDNRITCAAYFQLSDEDQLLEVLTGLFVTGETNSLQSIAANLITFDGQAVTQTITKLEQETGLEGITILYEIRESDGTLLAQALYDGTGRIA